VVLPKLDRISTLFPRSLASYITGEELASIAAPPTEQLPGYEVRRTLELCLTDAVAKNEQEKLDAMELGNICDHGTGLSGTNLALCAKDLAKHLFVCGLTGTGKTTTVRELLRKSPAPFLVIESAKRDYRQFLATDEFRDRLRVYTVGDATVSPLSMNPFYVMPGVSALVHIDFLKAIFNASFSLYGPMPYILEKCMHNVYVKRGWDLTTGQHVMLCDKDEQPNPKLYEKPEARHMFPNLVDLRDEVQRYVKTQLEYRGDLSDNIRTAMVTRIESLSVGAKGMLFGTSYALDIGALLGHPTVLELEALSDDDDKAFFVGMMLTFISEYRQLNNPAVNPYAKTATDLEHLLVIEEAHRLLKNVAQERQEMLGNPRGKAVEFFANVISEMRSMGQGVVVVEQIPSKILPDVIKNTNAKIVHRIVAADDQQLMASSLGLAPEEALHLTSLTIGHALAMKEGMQRPVEVAINAPRQSTRISHDKVRRTMQKFGCQRAEGETMLCGMRSVLGEEGESVALRTLCTLAVLDGSVAAEVVNVGRKAICNLLRQHDQKLLSETVDNYLIDRIVALLARGSFLLRGDSLWGIAAVLESVFSGTKDGLCRFQAVLAMGWQSSKSHNGILKRVPHLVVLRALNEGMELSDDSGIERMARSYFLVDMPVVCQQVIQYARGIGGEL